MKTITANDIAKMIDHSLLNPKFTRQEIEEGCKIAAEYDAATVCVKPCDVEVAYSILKDTDVLTTTVIGFPHGSNLTAIKVEETRLAIEQGCKEVDVVMNIGRFLSGDFDLVKNDIAAVVAEAHKSGVIVKVILENAYLTPQQVEAACKLCVEAEADFVKTSTGYAPTGAKVSDLKIMRAAVPADVQVKAAGGVRQLEDALAVRALGVTRFGCTTTAKMVEDARAREKEGTLVLPEPDEVEELSYLRG